MKIIVAEDDRTSRLLLTRALERWGYEITAVDDGEAAWEAVQSENILLIVTDWEMPRLDGPGLWERVRASPWGRYAYILLLTSHNDPVHIVQGLDAGADDFVAKPFNPTELRSRLGVGRRILSLHNELATKNRELEIANTTLARIAGTDALLQIGNRRSFEDAITRLHYLARCEGRPYGVILADVDHFKRFNDTYGHAFGDQVLAEVANTFRRSLGPEGTLYRYGGEEIIALVHDGRASDPAVIAERMRSGVAAMTVRRESIEAGVTASFGVASFDGREEVTCQVIVDRADVALYEAKAAGRDRVNLWTGRDASHRASMLSKAI